MDDSVRDRDSIRFVIPTDFPGEFGIRWGEVGNSMLRSRAGLVGVRTLDGVLDTEPMSGTVTFLRIGLVARGRDMGSDVEGNAEDFGGTTSTSILGRFRGGGKVSPKSGTSGRARREFLRP